MPVDLEVLIPTFYSDAREPHNLYPFLPLEVEQLNLVVWAVHVIERDIEA